MADIFQGAGLAADVISAVTYVLIYEYIQSEYIKLADDYYDLYKDERDFYYNVFQQTGEGPLNAEVFAEPFYTPEYAGVLNTSSLFYFNPWLANLKTNFPETLARKHRMFNVPDINFINFPSLATDMAAIDDDWKSYMFRYEEHKRDVLNERRWTHQMDSSAYGVKAGAQATEGLATSFRVFDDANGQLVSSVASLGNGLATYNAYNRKMNTFVDSVEAKVIPQSSNFTSDRIFASDMGG